VHGLTQNDVFGGIKGPLKSSADKVAAEYKDPLSGATWTGCGKSLKWIDGQDRAKFVIAQIAKQRVQRSANAHLFLRPKSSTNWSFGFICI